MAVGPARFIDNAPPNCSTLAEIRRRIIKKDKRNLLTRFFHSNNDKEVIATWKADLDRVLHIFNVRSAMSVASAWLLLTVRSQTELAINTHVAVSTIRHEVATTSAIVSDVHHNVVATHTVVSSVQTDVVNTHTMVSDIHHIMTKSQGGNGLLVSINRTLSIT